jgi:hypothetical protein
MSTADICSIRTAEEPGRKTAVLSTMTLTGAQLVMEDASTRRTAPTGRNFRHVMRLLQQQMPQGGVKQRQWQRRQVEETAGRCGVVGERMSA